MDTTAVQTALSRLGYAPGPIDGAWGAKTRGALVSFQAAKGLVADGWVRRRSGPCRRLSLNCGLRPPRRHPDTLQWSRLPR